MNTAAAQKLISIFNIPLEEQWNEYLQNNYLNYYEYFAGLKIVPDAVNGIFAPLSLNHTGMQAYLRKNYHYFEMAAMKGRKVADAGCGWGFLSFWFLLNGASAVYAIGFPYQIAFISRLYQAALKQKLIPPGSELIPVAKPFEEGDDTLGNQIRNELDYVIFSDVFEHIHDVIFPYALKASFNSLREEGKIISATHNTDNELVLKRMKEYWSRLEKDYIAAYRKKLIEQRLPGLNDAEYQSLVQSTQGMTMKDFENALTVYTDKKILPANNGLKPAVDLEYDYICENYISPGKIIRQMKSAGFRNCQCYPQLRDSRRYLPLWPFEKTLAPLLLKINRLSQSVIFTGEKIS